MAKQSLFEQYLEELRIDEARPKDAARSFKLPSGEVVHKSSYAYKKYEKAQAALAQGKDVPKKGRPKKAAEAPAKGKESIEAQFEKAAKIKDEDDREKAINKLVFKYGETDDPKVKKLIQKYMDAGKAYQTKFTVDNGDGIGSSSSLDGNEYGTSNSGGRTAVRRHG